MKQKHNEGFSLIEVLVGIVLLGVFVVPTCAGLVMSHRINAKTDAVMQAQLAVSSAVETLMAEGIEESQIKIDGDDTDYGFQTVDGVAGKVDRFPDVTMKIEKEDDTPYYNVVVTDNDDLVSVTTVIRAAPGEGGAP